jgi:hypothetical protein
MPQVTYTVGVLDASSTLLYRGTLQLQMQTDNLGATPTAGLLSLPGMDPLLLAAVSGSGVGWNLNGSNDSLSVQSTYIYANVQQQGQAPPYVSGSIDMAVAGQPARNLVMLGYTGSGAAPAQAQAHVQFAAAGAGAGVGATQYNWSMALLDTAFARNGTAAFTGTGQLVQIGPVSRQWHVTGTLTGEGLPAGGIAVQGWGNEFLWGGSGQGGNVQATLSAGTVLAGGLWDGTLTVNGAVSFFVATAVAQSIIAVPHIAGTSAAQPA